MKRRILMGAALGLCLLASASSVPLWAQWTGEIGAGYVWQNSTGNEDSFITQYGQHKGFVLDDFTLAYAPKQGQEVFSVKAWGFGGAEPAQHGSLFFRPGGGWTFNLGYDKQTDFYALAYGDEANRRSRWDIERWRGSVVYDGWSAARLTLNLRYYKKEGYVNRGIFGQNNVFPTRNTYDQDMKEASIKIETKTLPVYLSFEQAFSRYERQDRWSPNGSQAIFGTSNSSLVGLSTPRKDRTDIPSSRFIASYHNDWVDVAGSLFYSKSDMDSNGTRLTVYDVAPNAGQFRWLDDTTGSAKQDNKAANVDAAFRIGAGWSVRVAGDYRDTTQDSNLFGNYLLQLGIPGRELVLNTPVNDNGFFDVKDTMSRIELEKQGVGWAVFAGYQGGSRDVSWRREVDDPGENVNRSGNGWYVGGSWSRTPLLRVNAEYEHGTFSNYVFRTDPDLVERFTFKVSSRLGAGWTVGARARWEWAENPASQALAKRQAQSFGAFANWANSAGNAGFGLAADTFTYDSHTNIFLPGGKPDMSVYGVDMYTLTANTFFTVGKVRLDGDLTKVRDGGQSYPLETWGADLRATIDGPKGTQFVLFGQYHSYAEDFSSLNNYYVRRYGVILRWRF